MKLDFAGQELFLDASGMAFWPAQRIGIVSDLHLEKGSHFAARGFFLPPYDSHDTLTRLLTACRVNDVARLIILGDNFHDPDGYGRMNEVTRKLLEQLQAFDPVWIMGNHDAGFMPEHFKACDEFKLEGISFRHQAVAGAEAEISGHFHPKISLNGGRLQKDCFVTDGRKIIMPAFGAYTGGLSIHGPEISSLLGVGYDAYALGENRVFRLVQP